MSSAEAREVQDPAFMRWFNQNAAICLNDDNGETVDTENGNDELIADGSGPGDFDDNDNTKQKDDFGDSGENVNNDDDDDDDDNVDLVDNDHDADDNDENGFSDVNDNDVSIETLEDDVDSFHHIGFRREYVRLGSRMPNHRRQHDHSHQHRHHQHHCPRINWIQHSDLYAEFGFEPPAGKPDSI